MASSLRRLALDQASLRKCPLPPNYLFPLDQTHDVLPGDLTQLTVLVTGPQGTPYTQGLWKLHLRMPVDYPETPPKAFFKTRIWHPNVEECTGAICLETLKRDWDPKLTLRDILVTISCLLIHPNPESALNSDAGSLLRDDYAAFADQASLMTSIHARIPAEMRQAADAARRRGDEIQPNAEEKSKEAAAAPISRTERRSGPLLSQGKRRVCRTPRGPSLRPNKSTLPKRPVEHLVSEEDEEHDPSKENDPSKSPDPVMPVPAIRRIQILGKRPLSELPLPVDPDDGMTASEKNIAANGICESRTQHHAFESVTKSPKLSVAAEEMDLLPWHRFLTCAKRQ